MEPSLANDIGLLALRWSLAYVYLHGALMIAGNAQRRTLTAERSTVLLDNTSMAANLRVGRVLGTAASCFMIVGGAGLVAGLGTRIAACLLVAFTIPGIVVHLRELSESVAEVDRLTEHAGAESPPLLARLRWSIYAGHRSSANKNYALIGASVFLLLADDPNGRLSLSALLGS